MPVSKRLRVELTESFMTQLGQIEAFLTEADAHTAYDDLLIQLRTKVIPGLRQFPFMGRSFLDRAPQSAEALTQLARLPKDVLDTLREYLMGDYLILYACIDNAVVLLAIRHHRQLSFDFQSLYGERPA